MERDYKYDYNVWDWLETLQWNKHILLADIMDKYDNLGIIGEGSYGVVIKCKHKQSGQVSKTDYAIMSF